MTIWFYSIILDANLIDTCGDLCHILLRKPINTCAVNSHCIKVQLYFYFYMCTVEMLIKINLFK